MESILSKLLEQLNSSVFVLLVILAATGWGIWKISQLIERYTHHKAKIDKIDNLSQDVMHMTAKTSKIDKIDTLTENMIEMRVRIDLIYQNTNPNRTVAAASPIALTPIGKDVSTQINAERILEKYFDKLEKYVDESCPKNAYDVQSASMTATKQKLMGLLDAEEINSLKSVAFAKGLIIEDVAAVVGVLLRDRLLAKKGMPVADVDKHQVNP